MSAADNHLPLRSGTACDCGWSAGLSLNDTRSDMRQFVRHFEQVVAAEAAQEALTDALHPEFGTEWREPDGSIWQAIQQAKAEAYAEVEQFKNALRMANERAERWKQRHDRLRDGIAGLAERARGDS